MNTDKLDAFLRGQVRQAIQLTPEAHPAAEAPGLTSKMGGRPYAEAGDTWPACPTCKEELSFIAQIYNEEEGHLFVFHYCHTCFPWGAGLSVDGDWSVRIYDSPSASRMLDAPRSSEDRYALTPCLLHASIETQLTDWPEEEPWGQEALKLCQALHAEEPSEAYAEAIRRLGLEGDGRTTLGGYPSFIQNAVRPICPKCSIPMNFYGQIGSEDEAGLMWGDMGQVYFFRCSEHRESIAMELQCY